MKPAALTFVACLAGIAAARGQALNESERHDWQLRAEFLLVRLPQRAALAQLSALRSPAKIDSAVAKLRQQIASGDATLVAAPVLHTRNQARVTAEMSEEIRYATEFDPPMEPGIFATLTRRNLRRLSPNLAVVEYRRQFNQVPTAFETRNIGVSIEMEPWVRPGGGVVTMNLTTQHITFEGMFTAPSISAQATKWRYEQPQFRTHKMTTSLDVPSGQWTLYSIYPRPGAELQMELGLLRATSLAIDP